MYRDVMYSVSVSVKLCYCIIFRIFDIIMCHVPELCWLPISGHVLPPRRGCTHQGKCNFMLQSQAIGCHTETTFCQCPKTMPSDNLMSVVCWVCSDMSIQHTNSHKNADARNTRLPFLACWYKQLPLYVATSLAAEEVNPFLRLGSVGGYSAVFCANVHSFVSLLIRRDNL